MGISALLTTTMVGMVEAVAALREAGPRRRAASSSAARPSPTSTPASIGADGYAPDAATAVGVAQRLLGVRRARDGQA